MEKYINLSLVCKKISEETPSYLVQSWLRNKNTLEFLMLWEKKHNEGFNFEGYEILIQKLKANALTMTPKLWIQETNAFGLQSKQGRNGGTLAHSAIACHFMMWLSPRYQLAIIETFLLEEEVEINERRREKT